MILPSIENFLKILHFYQLNDIKSVKEKSKQSSKYISSDVFYNSLDYNYEQSEQGLKYPSDVEAIRFAINARLDQSKYFNSAGFPGSYAYNTPDAYMMKSFILDWSSTIKTFQDSTDRITNAYRLSSEECDKAIRGFGIDFVNARTLPSLNRRQTFLLNMCELYKIKGSPQSIIKALNIIGLENIYIQEAWVYPTRDGAKNIEIKWIPVDNPQQFDNIENKYYDDNDDLEVEYWDWGYFTDIISEISECHWFYKKQEILDIEYDEDTYIHLPSLTPYFNVKIKYNSDSKKLLMSNIFNAVRDQFRSYLDGKQLIKDCDIEGFGEKVSFLELWCAFIYLNICYADYLRYNSLKKFLNKFNLMTDVNLDDTNAENKYFNLIYKVYTYYKNLNDNLKHNFKYILSLYTQSSVPLYDLSYSQVKYWWLSNPHVPEDDSNQLTNIRKIIRPSKISESNNKDYVNVYWNENYAYGYYDVEIFTEDNLWHKVGENLPISSQSMKKIVVLNMEEHEVQYTDINELYDKIRIVHYRTEDNIPPIFFENPFYVNLNDRDTTMDMLYKFNTNIIHDSLFTNELFHSLYENQNNDIVNKVSELDLFSNLLRNFEKLETRTTDIDNLYKTYINSLINYPTSILKEDKEALYRTSFYDYVIAPTYNYINFVEHEGENLNYLNYGRRYPLNKKWNWAISYGKNINETYFYVNYESIKWCRIKSEELLETINIPVDEKLYGNDDYGIPFYENGIVWIKVCQQNLNKNSGCYFNINKDSCIMEEDWNALQYTKKYFPKSDSLIDFLDECKLDYKLANNPENNRECIEVTTPPSDLFPSSVIESKEYEYIDEEGETHTYDFYFCDTLIKPYSKLAKKVTVAKISELNTRDIYECVIDCFNDNRFDGDLNDNPIIYKIIEVTENPYGNNPVVKKYSYIALLKYLYLNGYTLDSNGFIYKRFNYYLDDNNYLYIKCLDISEVNKKTNDIAVFKWVRVKCSRKWSVDNTTKSIYYKLDDDFNYVIDVDGKRISNTFGVEYKPELTFSNVYDSKRYLSDPVLRPDNDSKTIDPVFNNLPDDCVDVLYLDNGFECYAKFDDIVKDNKTNDITTTFLKEKYIPKYIDGNLVSVNKDDSLLSVVNYGLNQDLLDYINTQIVKYSYDTDQFEELLLKLCESIQEYASRVFGIKETLDIYNSHVFKNRLIVNIINFYKPKRDRMLKLNVEMNIDEFDDVFGDGTGDQEYNNLFLNDTDTREDKYNKKENGLYNRSKIKHEINEYIPFDDLIYLDSEKVDTDVNNEREVYIDCDKINPSYDYFTKIDSFKNYPAEIKSKVVYPTFYCSNLEEKYNNFYYKDIVSNYYSNEYVFIKKEFVFKSICNIDSTYYTKPKFISLKLWCLTSKLKANSKSIFDCLYISNSNITDYPWLDSNNEPMMYRKLDISKSIDKDFYLENNFVEDYFLNGYFDKGIFQVYKDDNIYVKIGLNKIDPVFYFGNFEKQEFNGYYYNTLTKYGFPAYTNQKGKMICLFDMSELPDTYLDFCISDYRKDKQCKKFWIITDYKEIPDFSDAVYFAFEDGEEGKENIFEYDEYGILTEKTKTFYKCKDVTLNDYIYVSGVTGWNVTVLTEHPEYINKLDLCKSKYPVPDSYKDLIGRRVSQNIIPEKYTPVSYINFYFGYSLSNLYNNDINQIEYTSTRFNEPINLLENKYTFDDNGNNLAALHITSEQKLKIIDNSQYNNKTIVFRAKNNDSSCSDYILADDKWHTYAITVSNNHSYLYIDGKFIESINYNNYIEIISNDCSICEYAVFDVELAPWYIKVISTFGIFRYRKDVCLDRSEHKTDNVSTVYGKWTFGNPPRTEGDRVNSKYVDYFGNIYYKHPDPKNIFDTYKWNVLSRYYPNKTYEISTLWEFKTENRIYDRELIPEYNEYGEIDRVIVGERKYNHYKVEVLGNENFYREFDKSMFINGVEYHVPSNFKADGNIPVWYMKDPSTYKTGNIIHNPVHISDKEEIDDPYPIIKHGHKCINYFDYDHLTDGVSAGNDPIYVTEQYDDNTSYVLSLNKFVDENEFKEEYGIDVHDYNNDTIDGHDNNLCCACCIDDLLDLYFDPSTVHLNKNMKDNHIYHTKIILNNIGGKIDKKICGIYTLIRNTNLRQRYDLDYCYHHTRFTSNMELFSNIIHGNVEARWTSVGVEFDIIDLFERDVIVPIYFDISGHNYWELRTLSYKLIKPGTEFDHEDCYYIKQTKIIGNDGEDDYLYNYVVTLKKKAFTYIKNNYCVPYQSDDYDFINQYQFDICGQKLCSFDIDPQIELTKKDSMHIKQKIIHDVGFINYEGVKFVPYDDTQEFFIDKFDYKGRFYLDDGKLYIKHQQNWYGPFMVKNTWDNDITTKPPQLNDVMCIDIVYTRTNLYVRTQNNKWIEVYFEFRHSNLGRRVNEIFIYNDRRVCINVVFTDKYLPYWSYLLDIKNINQTLRIFRDFKYRIENKQNNDFYSGYMFKQTITEMMWIYVFYICGYSVDKLKIC